MGLTLWSKEEDDKLLFLYNKFGKNWDKIAQNFEGRSRKGIIERFYKIDPTIKSGKWDDEENKHLCIWLFQNVEDRLNTSISEFNGRRKKDVLKRVDFIKGIVSKCMFPNSEFIIKNEESKVSLKSLKVDTGKNKVSKRRENKRIAKEEQFEDEEDTDEFTNENINSDMNLRSGRKINDDKMNNIKNNSIKKESINVQRETKKYKKLSRDQFIELSGICNDSDQPWSKVEDTQLFELYSALGNNWSGISKFIEGRNAADIEQHFYSTLKWAAFEYKNDVDYGVGVLSQQFKNLPNLYVSSPMDAAADELEAVVPVAATLLNLDVSASSHKPLVKNEPVEHADDEVLANMYKQKFQSAKRKPHKTQNAANSELLKDTEELKKSVENFWWKQLTNNDDNSDVSASSVESDLSLVLSKKAAKLKAESENLI